MEGKINTGLKEFFNKFDKEEKRYSSICKVISINETTRTCILEPINGDAQRTGRLQASISLSEGVYVKPVIDSYVLLSFINNLTGVITQYSKIDQIITKIGSTSHSITDGEQVFDEGTDFAVRFTALETAYNQLKTDHDSLVTAFNTHVHPTAAIGPPSIPTPGVGIPASASTGDISGAKITEIKLP